MPSKKITCRFCRLPMKRQPFNELDPFCLALAVVIAGAGVLTMASMPLVGLIAGPLLLIGGVIIGCRRKFVWRCSACGSVLKMSPKAAEQMVHPRISLSGSFPSFSGRESRKRRS